MTIRSLLLASTVFPFALSFPALASDKTAGSSPAVILAQAEQTCTEGVDCPADGQSPAAETPAAEEPTSDTPAAEEPAAAAEEPAAAGQGDRRQRAVERARRQQEELQQQGEQPTGQAPESGTAGTTAEQPAPEQPATTEQPATADTPAAPAAQEPAAAQSAPGETRQQRRARLRAERQQQQQGQDVQGQPAAQPEPAQPAAEPEVTQPSTTTTPAQPVQPSTADAPAQPAPAPAAAGESTVEQQLEAQGDTEQANQVRELRRKLRQERAAGETEAPAGEAGAEVPAEESNRAERRRERREQRGGQVIEERGDRIIIDLGGGNLYVERSGAAEGDRLLYDARDVAVEELPGGETRTIVYRQNGSQIITLRNSYGDIITRTRITPNGREVVLIDNRIPVVVEGQPQVFQPVELPPLRVEIPQEQYIVDLGRADEQQIQQTLLAEPVEAVERAYTLEEVTRNERVRDKMSRIDLDTITFAFGSATIGTDQMQSLNTLGAAMEKVITENPDEVYLIEGHTDAVGSDTDNLILSDQRAEAVAVALSQNFEIPPENLVTEGYGEQYLKVETEVEERANRRVTVRRITPLLSAEAQQ